MTQETLSSPSLDETFLQSLHRLWPASVRERRILVAVSGGADSTALATLCRACLGTEVDFLALAHFHHHLRGESADLDASFVRDLAESWGVPFQRGDWDPETRGGNRHEDRNLPAAARRARYDFLAEAAGSSGCEVILTAHHARDQVETILQNLARGGGSGAFGGIGETGRWRGCFLLRPLLEIFPESLRAYLALTGVGHREDPSNADRGYRRNWVRHEILAALQLEGPDWESALLERWKIHRAQELRWREQARALCDRGLRRPGQFILAREALRGIPEEGRFLCLRETLRSLVGEGDLDEGWAPVTRETVERFFAVLAGEEDGSVNFPEGIEAVFEGPAVTLRTPNRAAST